jgi:16S rRNA (adenine(1408)-N(1))-methyltransferase
METLRGKHASFMNSSALSERLAGYTSVHIDIGTGDGRFVGHVAQAMPNRFVIGVDACRENLVDISRRAPANTLFVIANAQALPDELYGLAAHISINFPWGSLIDGLLNGDVGLMAGLQAVAQPNAALEVRLNGGAMTEAGWDLAVGVEQVQSVLASNGFAIRAPKPMLAAELKLMPTTWAKRIAFGRDPRAFVLRGTRQGEAARDEAVLEALRSL